MEKSDLAFLAILGCTRVSILQPFCESQVIFIQGNLVPVWLSWKNSSLKLQPFHDSQVISILVNVIPGFLGYSWQCSSQLLQPLCESQDMFGNSWLSWLFLLFLLWSNSRLSLKAKSYLLALQAFLGIPLQAFQENQEFPCFSGLFQAF